ncbi:MAG: CBS domain-containing protein [Planctomycetes bacterium]|nr:CBS domain-containing protein [Planctomycetota bacterium]
MSKRILARDLMSRPVRQLTTGTPLRDAAAFLLRHGISGAPVVDEHGKWVGVFTQSDLARYLESRILPPSPERTLESREEVAGFAALSPDKIGEAPVRRFMTPGLFTVFPEATLEEVVRTLTSFKVHRVFVIDEQTAELLGVITSMDLLRFMDGRRAPKSRKTQRV